MITFLNNISDTKCHDGDLLMSGQLLYQTAAYLVMEPSYRVSGIKAGLRRWIRKNYGSYRGTCCPRGHSDILKESNPSLIHHLIYSSYQAISRQVWGTGQAWECGSVGFGGSGQVWGLTPAQCVAASTL